MKPLNSTTAIKAQHPERIIQFGEGNFLRGFVDWIVQQLNRQTDFDASVVIVKPRAGGSLETLQSQDCLYHVNLQGLIDGQPVNSLELIDCVSRALNPYTDYDDFLGLASLPDVRFVVSNTTEAGITFDDSCRLDDMPPASYPAKLTQLLWHRFCAFQGDPAKGLIILPCELTIRNGQCLTDCILRHIDSWACEMGDKCDAFRRWFVQSCYVCNTLVDRIVPGAPRKDIDALQQRMGYADALVVQSETFYLWVIETAPGLSMDQLNRELPVAEAGLNVILTTDETPYHERKVTLLNGPHTVLSPVAFLAGLNIVREACQHETVGRFVRQVMYEELLPTLNLPEDELRQFADDVMQRFLNPYVDHQLTSIMLNSFPKYRTRDLPAMKTYLQRQGRLPRALVLGLAAICIYYRGGSRPDGTPITPADDPRILELLATLWHTDDCDAVARGVLAAELIWGENLNEVPGLTALLAQHMRDIQEHGILQLL